MFEFANPEYFYFLFLLPIFIFLFYLTLHLKKKSIKKFGDFEIVKQLMPEFSNSRPQIKFFFLIISLFFLIFAISQARSVSKIKTENKSQKGIEIMIALDISNSMMAEDIKPNRLESSKRAIYRLIEKLENDKIGLIVFAGEAYIQLPLTTDFQAAKMFLNNIDVGFINKQGTSISSAIELAMSSFSTENDKNKALIIITDGENHEEDAIKIAEEARKEENIFVHTVGMGLPKGAPIPVKGKRSYKKDKNGATVISKLNEKTLAEISKAGGGIYVRANNATTSLNILFKEISKMSKSELKISKAEDFENYFQYFIALSLFFLMLEFMILEKKNKFFQKFNLFEKKIK